MNNPPPHQERMESCRSYESCTTGDSFGSNHRDRMADFDLNDKYMSYRGGYQHRGGDAPDRPGRFNRDHNEWPNLFGRGPSGSAIYTGPDEPLPPAGDCPPFDGPTKVPAAVGKYRQLMPQRRAGELFDQVLQKKAPPAEPVTARGIRLGSSWTYWHIAAEGGTEQDWKAGMKPMCTFDQKEQFWGMWNSIKPPSELGAKRELALFRGGVGRRPVWPDWNDSENIDGGRWKVIFRVTELPQIVDNFWRDLMVHCIEERWVPYSGFVNGVSITVKGQFYRIYIWLCSSKPAYVEFIRDRAKELLKDIPYVHMDYITGNGERPQMRSHGNSGSSIPEEPLTTAASLGDCRADRADYGPSEIKVSRVASERLESCTLDEKLEARRIS